MKEIIANGPSVLVADQAGHICFMSTKNAQDRSNLPPFIPKATTSVQSKEREIISVHNILNKQDNNPHDTKTREKSNLPTVVFIAQRNGTIHSRQIERKKNGYDLSAIIFSEDEDGIDF
jgi:hypothetical protein